MRSQFATLSITILLYLIPQLAIAQDKAFLEAVELVSPQVKTITLPQGEITQSFVHLEGNLVEVKTEMAGSKAASVKKYVFNLADIALEELSHEIYQKGMYVKLSILDGAKYIHKSSDDGNIDFISEVRIAVDDADHSRDLIANLKPSIEFAQKAEAERYKQTSLAEINQELSKSIGFSFDGQKEQSWSSEPGKEEKIRYEIKGESGTEAFSFNLKDVDPEQVETTVTRRAITLSLGIKDREKFIKTFEDDTPKNFVSKVSLYPLDIENVKHVHKLITMGLGFLQEGDTAESN